ncbi:MAG TPA: hypothetical protein VFI73_08450 [Candidatus Nitrosopolaris sp.]|nr:hypothetical protein [Candidatus Nitrosopolaris sp.]
MVEFETWLEFDRQLLLIHERLWHTSPSQLVLWIALILLEFVEILAFAGGLEYSIEPIINIAVNNTNSIIILWFIPHKVIVPILYLRYFTSSAKNIGESVDIFEL